MASFSHHQRSAKKKKKKKEEAGTGGDLRKKSSHICQIRLQTNFPILRYEHVKQRGIEVGGWEEGVGD